MNDRHYNFSPGPAMLPLEVMQKAQEEFLTWNGRGVSVVETSHRGGYFAEILERAEANVRNLMNVPNDYSVTFIPGGASLQFTMLPMNCLCTGVADYLITGSWSEKAYEYGKATHNLHDCMNGKKYSGLDIPAASEWDLSDDSSYFHFAYNETIHGVMFQDAPVVNAPLVTDASSCILSLPIDASKYGCIYSGAQKNLGPAGIGLVILSPEMLERSPHSGISPMLSLREWVNSKSLLNTTPTFVVYMVGLVLDWVVEQGGVDALYEINKKKASLVYDAIDNSNFYINHVDKNVRSICNIPFTLATEEKTEEFIAGAEATGLVNLRQHRSLGGLRASMYNSMPMAGAEALVGYMKDFERNKA